MELEEYEICKPPSNALLMEYALRSFFSVIAMHILAGEVDTDLSHDGATLASKLWWLARYFNPVNLKWRYYSILAYRCYYGKLDQKKQLAIINFESFPYKTPLPYVVTEQLVADYEVRRLQISGLFSSQGLLSIVAAYQGMIALQHIMSAYRFGYLPNISEELAILGLFRAMVSLWIADKVYVDPHTYPSPSLPLAISRRYSARSRVLAGLWILAMCGLVFVSAKFYFSSTSNGVATQVIDRCIEALYNYTTVSALLFHTIFISYGPLGLSNRNPLFDHWSYQAQTVLFFLMFVATFVVGILDFIHHNFYRDCIVPL